jgi:hypothetical protein
MSIMCCKRKPYVIWKFVFSIAMLLLLSDSAFSASRYAVTLDVKGEVTLISEFGGFEDESPLAITNYISHGNKIQLAKGSKVVLLRLDDYQQIVYTGPVEILVRPELSKSGLGNVSNPFAIKGAGGGRLLAALGAQKSTSRMPQAVIGIRGVVKKSASIRLISPVDWERVLNTHPTFTWNHIADTGLYHFVLREKNGDFILNRTVDTNSLTLSASIKLKSGTPYTWEVSSLKEELTFQSEKRSFQTATKSDRADFKLLAAKKDATISDHVLHAMILEKMGFITAAKKQWQVLHNLKPNDLFFRRKAK